MAFPIFTSTPQPQYRQSLFQTPTQQTSFPQNNIFLQQQQLQQQPLYLFTNDKSPARYNTKWADLHQDSQKFLRQIEERILEYRDESQRLDACDRLYDSSQSNNGFELDASRIMQELGEIYTAMERERVFLHSLMMVAKDMLRDTEVAVRSFMMLCPKFIHSSSPDSSALVSGQISAGPTVPSGQSTSLTPVFDFYRGIPKRPSTFLQRTVARFEKYLEECRQWIEELEQLLHSKNDGNSSRSDTSLLQSLPKVMSNVYDFFVHVAAKVDNLHQHVQSMKTAYLADQRMRGDGHDPFLEAERREIARQEAAARRVHPTLHLLPQPSTQAAGLFSTSSSSGSSLGPQPLSGLTSSSTGSGLSVFGSSLSSASSAAASTTSLFSTPSASAPPSLFGTPGFSTQSSLFSSVQTASAFGSSIPSFSSVQAFGSSPLFSTPFASGAATGSGASFGATSRSTKLKSRTARR